MATKKWIEDHQEKLRGYRRTWYYRNKEHALSHVKKRKKEIKLWFKEIKKKHTCSCGESDPVCFDFHHEIESEKKIAVSVAVQKAWSRDRILKEIQKCVLLCANCHRKRHNQKSKI